MIFVEFYFLRFVLCSNVVDSDYACFLQPQQIQTQTQKSKSAERSHTSSSPVAEYVPRSDTGTFRTSLSHKSSERGSNTEINNPSGGTLPQNPTLPAFEEHSEGESPVLEALDTWDFGEGAPEATLGDTLRVSTTALAPEPTQHSEASSPGRIVPSTSTGPTLSSEESAVMKKDNPLAYLKAIINARGSSTEKSISASTASGDMDPNDALLRKLKAKFFDADLFQVLKSNNLAIYDLRALLKQVDLLSVTPEVAEMVTELGLMVENVSNELVRLQQATEVIESNSKDQTSAWDEATSSTNKVVALEEEN